MVITTPTGSDDIVPDILATLDHRGDMVAGQVVVTEGLTAIKTHVGITFEQGRIIQRWDVAVTELAQGAVMSQRRNNGVHLNKTAAAGFRTDAAVYPVQQGATGIGNLLQMVEAHRVLVADPLERHTRNVCPQNLMTQIHHLAPLKMPANELQSRRLLHQHTDIAIFS